MKTALLIVWAFVCSASLAQTNAFIIFTNRNGIVVSNAEVVKIFPNKLIWEQNPGTISEIPGVVKLVDLPPDIQARFGYDAQKAAAADEKEKSGSVTVPPATDHPSSEPDISGKWIVQENSVKENKVVKTIQRLLEIQNNGGVISGTYAAWPIRGTYFHNQIKFTVNAVVTDGLTYQAHFVGVVLPAGTPVGNVPGNQVQIIVTVGNAAYTLEAGINDGKWSLDGAGDQPADGGTWSATPLP